MGRMVSAHLFLAHSPLQEGDGSQENASPDPKGLQATEGTRK